MDVPRIKSWLSGFVNTIDQLSALSMMSNKDTSSTDRQDKAPPTDISFSLNLIMRLFWSQKCINASLHWQVDFQCVSSKLIYSHFYKNDQKAFIGIAYILVRTLLSNG